jgi:hypothetical protein
VISPGRVARRLSVMTGLLVIGSIAGQASKFFLGRDHLFGLVRLLDVNQEAAIPAWFSSAALLGCGVVLAVIASVKRGRGARDTLHWVSLAVLFVYLSVDEAAGIHELWGEPLRGYLPREGYLYFTWVLPAVFVVGAVALVYLRFVWNLPATTRFQFVVAAALFVGGALGVETLSGKWVSEFGRTFGFSLLNTVEEALELCGIAVFLFALLQYVANHCGPIRLVVEPPEGTSAG